ncbi:PAS domain-containing protein [uncultured Microscilla sp.]|uniref:PAS domain-containing protein n=1 Tax=uncultured Microscilla sp. TaxID=432653 RepID=UPI002616745D|nr:PAS domain-containing protein [uncultured Microscilla sp.]
MVKLFGKEINLNFGAIKTRLIASFALIGLFVLLIILVAYLATSSTIRQNSLVMKIYQPTNQSIQALQIDISQTIRAIQKRVNVYYDSQEEFTKNLYRDLRTINKLKRAQVKHLEKLNAVFAQYNRTELKDIFQNIQGNLKKVNAEIDKCRFVVRNSEKINQKIWRYQHLTAPTTQDSILLLHNEELANLLEVKLVPLEAELYRLVKEFIFKNNIVIQETNHLLNDNLQMLLIMEFLMVAILCIIIFFAIQLLMKYLNNDLEVIVLYIKKLLNGEIPKRPFTKSHEFMRLAHHLNALIKDLVNLRKFALRVNDNKFDNNEALFKDSGDLGAALAQMRDGLKQVSDENKERYWSNAGIAKFSDILRSNVDNLSNMGNDLISNLVKYLEINQGGFFTVEQDQENKEEYLQLTASYAYNSQKYLEKKVLKGQGLIGQAWVEKNTIYLKDIPKDYAIITSGMGEATPTCIVIVPLHVNGMVLGVIELGAFHDIAPYKVEFIEKIAKDVASSIAATRANEQTRLLLTESQEKTETMERQEEIMRKNVRQLQDTQNVMRQAQKELATKEANLDALINSTPHAMIAFDLSYRVTAINKSMRKRYIETGVNLDIGNNMLDAMAKEEIEKHQNEYKRVLSGEKFVVMHQSIKNNQEFFYLLNYNPIKDNKGKVIGASLFIEDISQQQRAQMSLKETERNLKSLINNTEDAIVAFNQDYEILVVNDKYKEKFKDHPLRLEAGARMLDFLEKGHEEEWKAYYERALGGESFMELRDETIFGFKPRYLEYWFNPIYDEGQEVTGVSIFSRDVSEARSSERKVRQLLLESLESEEKLRRHENDMQKRIVNYEKRIKDLEEQIKIMGDLGNESGI